MTTAAHHPYDWVRSVEPSLIPVEARPLIPGPEAFSWSKLGQLLANHFEIPDLHVEVGRTESRTPDKYLEGMNFPTTTLQFAIGSLPGFAHWVISTADADALMYALLAKQPLSLEITDTAFREGFIHYIGAEMAVLLGQLGFTDALTPRFVGRQP